MSLEKTNRRQHDRTLLINDNEYSSLINLIDKSNGVALVMATVQLWFSEKPNHKDWHKAHTGIICFVKDYSKKSYYFRMFNLPPRQLWEQEMYTPFSYVKISDNFHYFPADDCNAGLNFAKVDEAEKFLNTIYSKIQSKSSKKKNMVKNQENTINNGLGIANRMILSSQPIILNTNPQVLQPTVREQETSKYNTIKNKKNKKIDKSQISNPTGFRIVQHVGLSTASNNFEISLSSEDSTSKKMQEILESLNCPVNKKTKQFLNNYIKSHGGIEIFDEELKKKNKPALSRDAPVHPSQPPKTLNQVPARPPPGLPNRAANISAAPPPPPPPLPQTLPPSIQVNTSSNAPPTPPLPPMKSSSSMAPPPPPPLPSLPPETQANQARVAAPAPPPPPPPPPPSLSDINPSPLVIEKKSQNSLQQNQTVDSRDQLLESIRGFQGFQNKNPSRNRISDPAPVDNNPPSVLDQLKNELIKRAQFLNDSSDEGSDDESDSEWNS